MQSRSGEDVRLPPQTVGGILRQLSPGLIIAGSIVGSGELIATTKTGAQAGFWFLWLIIVGCVIKVFAQVEFGRYAICCGKGTMAALDEVPGPQLPVFPGSCNSPFLRKFRFSRSENHAATTKRGPPTHPAGLAPVQFGEQPGAPVRDCTAARAGSGIQCALCARR